MMRIPPLKYGLMYTDNDDIFTKKVFERTDGRYQPKVQEKHCATERYYKSAVPYMSRMLNSITFCTSNSNN